MKYRHRVNGSKAKLLMRVAMFGIGSFGAYFGDLLARAGRDVTFIARGSNLDALRRRELTLKTQGSL
jgi:2-dehydropantoate 2-reductase